MTRSLGQVAYEARWAVEESKLWQHAKFETQRRFEEAAQAVQAALVEPCEHAQPLLYQLPEGASLAWCWHCGAHRLDFARKQGGWLLPRRR